MATSARFDSLKGHVDAYAFVAPTQFTEALASPVGSITNSSGLVGYHVPASSTAAIYGLPSPLLLRTGEPPYYQEEFGTAAGVAGPSGVSGTSSPYAQPYPYTPPFTGASQLSPQTGYVPKGLKLIGADVIYLVSTTTLTTLNFNIGTYTFVGGAVPPSLVSLIGATNLTKTHSADVYVINTAIATANQAYTVTADTEFEITVNCVTPASSTFDLYGVVLYFHENYS